MTRPVALDLAPKAGQTIEVMLPTRSWREAHAAGLPLSVARHSRTERREVRGDAAEGPTEDAERLKATRARRALDRDTRRGRLSPSHVGPYARGPDARHGLGLSPVLVGRAGAAHGEADEALAPARR